MNYLLLNVYLPIKQFFAGFIFDFIQKEFRTNGNVYTIPKELTSRFFRGAFTLGWYEKQEREFIPKYLDKNASVLELGGCIGVVSCVINGVLNERNKHVTVEANPFLIQHLEHNKERNHCGFHVENRIVAKAKTVTFNIQKSIVQGSANIESAQKVEVEGITPEELEKKYNLKFDTLIMDIEGGELQFFRDFQPFLKTLKSIYFEIHPFENILTLEEAEECESILKALGFQKKLDEDYFQIWEK
ncbi:FkbM family methyltransferase [Flammeovirga sp. EKP202]|uniref:FkbM family methyltransferase n=1 Tax=Flammeovirga sp. EKP202 TaxID=2770592 RepID=UPI00165EF2FC|nr:FkbM family methyltransferase [Flammeovirga sp. EKP202]MBD0403393.1 FkbM family methyltransferase [Flammeovirga sp. EKP202]